MVSYRFKRRAFLTAVGGGLGLKIMLRNLEASAQGMKSPPRLLVTNWPVGIVAGTNDALYKPTSGSVTGSIGLKGFADAGLGPDMTTFRGLSTANFNTSGVSGHQEGLITMMTGKTAGGSRTNCCQGDDGFASPGGSFDQLLLRDVPALQAPLGYANSIADSRTDFGEVGTRVMSYSTTSRPLATYSGGMSEEATPLMPVLSPLDQYNALFSTFVPGGGGTGAGGAGGGAGTRPVGDAMMRKLVRRKSVLDFAVEELNQLKALAPVSARNKLSIHTDAVQMAQQSLAASINTAYPPVSGGGGAGGTGAGGSNGNACTACSTKPANPGMGPFGEADPPGGRGSGNAYGRSMAMKDDGPTHQLSGKAHMDVLRAAFICDLIRVGTFQWSPGQNHVGFKLYPGDSTNSFMHHPTSHRIGSQDTYASATVEGLGNDARFCFNVQNWYFSRHAENLKDWKNSVDACGNNLLDFTVVPFITEVAALGHERTNMAGMIIGGKKLGFTHNIYRTGALSGNDFWATIGQAFGHPGGGVFGNPATGLWTKPA